MGSYTSSYSGKGSSISSSTPSRPSIVSADAAVSEILNLTTKIAELNTEIAEKQKELDGLEAKLNNFIKKLDPKTREIVSKIFSGINQSLEKGGNGR